MNALRQNRYTQAWAVIGREIPRPRAALCVSAHWYMPAVAATAMSAPPTIHDIGGFPRALHEFQYPAKGDPALVERIQDLLAPIPVAADYEWGLDHGTWSVLCHVFPGADVPVVQLSIDSRRRAACHLAIGERLAPLRDEGVLVIGSGNIVHNLAYYAWQQPDREPYPWALSFERRVRQCATSADAAALAAYERWREDAPLAARHRITTCLFFMSSVCAARVIR